MFKLIEYELLPLVMLLSMLYCFVTIATRGDIGARG
jgi:hypothetical protein